MKNAEKLHDLFAQVFFFSVMCREGISSGLVNKGRAVF